MYDLLIGGVKCFVNGVCQFVFPFLAQTRTKPLISGKYRQHVRASAFIGRRRSGTGLMMALRCYSDYLQF